MNVKKLEKLPQNHKERIEKSCLILSRFGKSKLQPKTIDDYGIVIITENGTPDFGCTIKEIYCREDDFRINELKSFPSNSLRSIALADVVINESGYIIKNRYGVDDNTPSYKSLMNSMTYEELEKYLDYETVC